MLIEIAWSRRVWKALEEWTCLECSHLGGMRRLCVDGGFLNDGSLLLGDETTIPAITRYLLADPADDRMLFFEVGCL